MSKFETKVIFITKLVNAELRKYESERGKNFAKAKIVTEAVNKPFTDRFKTDSTTKKRVYRKIDLIVDLHNNEVSATREKLEKKLEEKRGAFKNTIGNLCPELSNLTS